ncbi:unnamed protein product [Lampetra planeri]
MRSRGARDETEMERDKEGNREGVEQELLLVGLTRAESEAQDARAVSDPRLGAASSAPVAGVRPMPLVTRTMQMTEIPLAQRENPDGAYLMAHPAGSINQSGRWSRAANLCCNNDDKRRTRPTARTFYRVTSP